MKFGVSTGPSLTRNALLNRSNKDAAYKQTQSEHDEALNRFIEPGMDPIEIAVAKKRGEMEEQNLPKYWEDDSPRRDLNPSSSFIENIEYLPSMNMARIQMGGKVYDFPGFTPEQVGDMITSGSIGGYLWDHDRWLTKHRK